MTKKQFFEKYPVIETYKGYEILKCGNMYEVIMSVGVYWVLNTDIKDCYSFIDKMKSLNIKQYDDENVAKYIFKNKRK